jgi:Protein of unknown function (DUF3592)
MANLTLARTTQRTTASGLAGLFGLFAGLCAIFAGGVTLIDWRDEVVQSRWTVLPAIVERADVIATRRDSGGTRWNLRTRVRYEAGGETRTATLTSRTAVSESDATRLQAWAAQHRKGSHIDIRVDPSQQNRAVFASDEIASAAGRTRTDLILLAIAAIASAGLLALAKVLRAREVRAAPVADDAQRGGLAIGLAVAVMGLTIAGFVIDGAIHADPFSADRLMGVPAGLMFFFAGILLALPPQYAKWRNLLATLLITCFAITFDWVAFGPGERHFTGSIMGFGFIPGELMGRIAFGAFAVILDALAIAMWIGQCRRGFGPGAAMGQGGSATTPADSTA